MANKAHDFGLVTQEVINGREQITGKGRKFGRELTKEDVLYALSALLKSNPNFDNLTPAIAADRIVKELKDLGFTGNLSNSGGVIKDDHGNAFRLSHGKYKGKSIFTVNKKR